MSDCFVTNGTLCLGDALAIIAVGLIMYLFGWTRGHKCLGDKK